MFEAGENFFFEKNIDIIIRVTVEVVTVVPHEKINPECCSQTKRQRACIVIEAEQGCIDRKNNQKPRKIFFRFLPPGKNKNCQQAEQNHEICRPHKCS